MRINHNIAALNTHRQLGQANNAQQNSMEKLSSGLRINNASDDAAGLAISEKMRGQIRGLDQAQKNAQDGISMTQTAEGALNETHDILQRMRELATQAANDTNTETDRGEIQKEVNQLTSEINRIGNTTEFNTQKLLDGGSNPEVTTVTAGVTGETGPPVVAAVAGVYEFDLDVSSLEDGQSITIESNEYTYQADGSGDFSNVSQLTTAIGNDTNYTATESNGTFTLTQTAGNESPTGPEVSAKLGFTASFQVGANEGQSMSIEIDDMRANALGLTGDAGTGNFAATNNVTDGTNNQNVEASLDVSTHEKASNAITQINEAIEQVSAQRSDLGAYQNRLDHTINNLGTSSENLTAAESRIRDVDMAKEMMNQTKSSILSQASQAMLAKANQQPQGVLQLLR